MAGPAADTLTPEVARALAAELFVLGFPLLMMDAVRRSHPVTTSLFRRLPPDAGELAAGLLHDDPCTVQTSALIDLSQGPAVLHLPDMRGRYFSLTLIDAAGEPFASLGSRTGEHAGVDIALAGPHWHGELNGRVRARRAPSDLVWAVSRIVGNSLADIPQAELLAARQRVVPQRRPDETDPPGLLQTLETWDLPSPHQIAGLAPEILLHRLGQLVERAPSRVRSRIAPQVALKLAQIPSPGDAAWPSVEPALSRGFAQGLASILAAAETSGEPDPNHWRTLGEVAGGGELADAARTLAFLGGPMRDDVLVLGCTLDESGRPLTGEERYRICFAPGALPPAEAAWRLSAADLGARSETAIGDHNDLVFARNGGLEILIQSDSPATAGVNWLASPPGLFRLTMRLYWPGAEALSGQWRMAPVERLGSRFARRSLVRPRTLRRSPTSPRDARPPLSGWDALPSGYPGGRDPRAW